MNELLIENNPGKESPDDFQLMKELHQTTEAMQERAGSQDSSDVSLC